jgi:hypothetical protein
MLLSALLLAASPAFAPDVSQLQTIPLHMVRAPLAKSIESAAGKDRPYLFAVRADLPLELADGVWDSPDANTDRWRLRVSSPGAQSLNLELERFHLPKDASLWIYDADGKLLQGPYTAGNHTPEGKLWTAVVLGEQLVLELRVPHAERDAVDLKIGAVNHGFRGFGKVVDPEGGLGTSGSCEIDVICPLGDAWRPQIRAVARYSIGGQFLCTGQLINDVPQDEIPYFLTANHCDIGQSGTPASSIVVYWRFENSQCNGPDDANPGFSQTGSTLIASDKASDFSLVRLNQSPNANATVYFTGWNASHTAIPTAGAVFHHPSGDAKKLAIYDPDSPSPPAKETLRFNGASTSVWDITYSHGTTEEGSSGAGLLDQDHRLIGTLSGGAASCSDLTGEDIYGRFEVAWETKSAATQQLKHWLDPCSTGTLALDGHEPGTGTGASHAPIAANDTFSVAQNSAQTSFDPRANDSDPDSDALTISDVGTPSHGTAVITGSGAGVAYTPATGFSGTDSFTYTISDGHCGSATATVSVAVTAPPPGDGGGGGALPPLTLLAAITGLLLRRRLAAA